MFNVNCKLYNVLLFILLMIDIDDLGLAAAQRYYGCFGGTILMK